MTNKRRASQILWIECVGFLLIVALSWVNEIAQLPRLLFGGSVQSNLVLIPGVMISEKPLCSGRVPALTFRAASGSFLNAGRDNFRDNPGDNRRSVSPTVSYT